MADFVPGPDTGRLFRDALGRFATGVTLISTKGPDGPIGIVANSFASVSLDPPLVLWSPAKSSRRFGIFEKAQHYAIHVLSDAQKAWCGQISKDGSDFDGIDWSEGDHGVPLIHGTLARFECSLDAAHDAGDHVILVGRVTTAQLGAGAPLLFANGSYGAFTPAS
ncbi:MAG: flavin reductase family protein [Pseudomonadota bacterium]